MNYNLQNNTFNLNSLNDKLLLNKTLTKYQIQELLRTEAALKSLKNGLISQNETLNILIKEGWYLEEEIKKSLLNKAIIIGLKKEDMKVDKRKGSYDAYYESKPKKLTQIVNESITEMQIKIYNSLIQLQIPQLKNKSIHSINNTDSGIYIGGSNGLLLRYIDGDILEFDNCTNEDIIQISVIRGKHGNIVMASTKTKIINYSITGIKESFKDVPDVRDTFNIDQNFSDVYGKFNVSNFRGGNFKFSLISLEDSKLYKVKSDDWESRKAVKGVTHVKEILMFTGNKCLCYSDNTIWMLNSNCAIIDTVVFSRGIKLVKWRRHYVIIVNTDNTVYIFKVPKDNLIKIHEEHIDGDIIAVGIDTIRCEVCVAIGDCIYIFKYNLKP